MENPKFQIFRSQKDSQYYYRLRAANGEIILSGEGYTSKQSCLAGVAAVRINSINNERYILKSEYFDYSFNLLGRNGEIVGRSERNDNTGCILNSDWLGLRARIIFNIIDCVFSGSNFPVNTDCSISEILRGLQFKSLIMKD